MRLAAKRFCCSCCQEDRGEGDFILHECSLIHSRKGASPLCLLAAVLLCASWTHTLLLRLSDLQCDAVHAESITMINSTQGATVSLNPDASRPTHLTQKA